MVRHYIKHHLMVNHYIKHHLMVRHYIKHHLMARHYIIRLFWVHVTMWSTLEMQLGAGCDAGSSRSAAVPRPSPATHAILTVLKAGESVFQTFLLTKTEVHAYRGAQPLFHALFLCQNTV